MVLESEELDKHNMVLSSIYSHVASVNGFFPVASYWPTDSMTGIS